MKLLTETRWGRVYEVKPNHQLYESKFQKEGLSVLARELVEYWRKASQDEKLDFITAYLSKPVINVEDEKILDFLIEHGDARVWEMMAVLLPRHPNKKKALRFLFERLDSNESKANFIEAICLMADPEAITHLIDLHDRLRAETRVSAYATNRWVVYDFLACCAALIKFGVRGRYEAEIKDFFDHPDLRVRAKARAMLEGYPTFENPAKQ